MYKIFEICTTYFRPKGLTKSMLVILQVSIMFVASAFVKDDNRQALIDLDKVLASREEYSARKENRIASLKASLRNTTSAVKKFDLQKKVYAQYIDYQLDSALNYAEQMRKLSEIQLSAHPEYEAEALLSIARVYTHTGKYNECAEILTGPVFSKGTLSADLKRLYFEVQLALNRGLVEIKHEREAAEKGIQASIDSLQIYIPSNTIWSAINTSHKYRAQGDNERSLAVLLEAYPHAVTDDEKSSITYYISLLYNETGDREMSKKFYIMAADLEIKTKSKKVYASLMELAVILYEEGDLERAHRYIEISLADAVYCGSYRFILKIQRILPQIAQAYNAKITQEKEKVTRGMFIIAGLLVLMIFLVAFVLWQNKRLFMAKAQTVRANRKLSDTNAQLDAVGKELHLRNAELQLANSQLVFLNKELVEMNRVKETYLSKFIDLCAEYIDKLDVYRLNLSRLAKSNDMDVLLKELKSTKFVEEEFRQFLANFDETFLKVYPGFVEEFNRLFPEHERQTLKTDELLNTELRIFALIRLGVVDSSKIAKFLRCSITTVYTYRSKVKNKSLCPDEFEERVMEFSREEISF